MSISGIGNGSEQAVLQLKRKGDRGKIGDPLEKREKLTAITTGVASVPRENRQEEGVVELLREGHFRGVADVRLRINFNEQLQRAASEKSAEVLKTASGELIVELEGKVQVFGQEYQVADEVGELLSGFREEAEGLLDGGGAEGGDDAGSVIGGLRDAFASLFTSLQKILAAGDREEGEAGEAAGDAVAADAIILEADDTPAVEMVAKTDTLPPAVAQESDTWAEALEKLQEWAEAEITALETVMNDLQTLPETSAPSGNGAAYSRFLEMYKSLEAGKGSTRIHGKV